jgi:hypothetical protein
MAQRRRTLFLVPEHSTWAMMLLGRWLNGLSPEVKASIDGRVIHDHQV